MLQACSGGHCKETHRANCHVGAAKPRCLKHASDNSACSGHLDVRGIGDVSGSLVCSGHVGGSEGGLYQEPLVDTIYDYMLTCCGRGSAGRESLAGAGPREREGGGLGVA